MKQKLLLLIVAFLASVGVSYATLNSPVVEIMGGSVYIEKNPADEHDTSSKLHYSISDGSKWIVSNEVITSNGVTGVAIPDTPQSYIVVWNENDTEVSKPWFKRLKGGKIPFKIKGEYMDRELTPNGTTYVAGLSPENDIYFSTPTSVPGWILKKCRSYNFDLGYFKTKITPTEYSLKDDENYSGYSTAFMRIYADKALSNDFEFTVELAFHISISNARDTGIEDVFDLTDISAAVYEKTATFKVKQNSLNWKGYYKFESGNNVIFRVYRNSDVIGAVLPNDTEAKYITLNRKLQPLEEKVTTVGSLNEHTWEYNGDDNNDCFAVIAKIGKLIRSYYLSKNAFNQAIKTPIPNMTVDGNSLEDGQDVYVGHTIRIDKRLITPAYGSFNEFVHSGLFKITMSESGTPLEYADKGLYIEYVVPEALIGKEIEVSAVVRIGNTSTGEVYDGEATSFKGLDPYTCRFNVQGVLDAPIINAKAKTEIESGKIREYDYLTITAPSNYVGEADKLTIHYIYYSTKLKTYAVEETSGLTFTKKYNISNINPKRFYGAYVSAPGYEDSKIVYAKYHNTLEAPYLTVNGERLAKDATVPYGTKVEIVNPNAYKGSKDAGKFPTVLGNVVYDSTIAAPADFKIDAATGNGSFSIDNGMFSLKAESLIGDGMNASSENSYNLSVKLPAPVVSWGWESDGSDNRVVLQAALPKDVQMSDELKSRVSVPHVRFGNMLNPIGEETTRNLAKDMINGFAWQDKEGFSGETPLFEARLVADGYVDSDPVLATFNGNKIKLPAPVVSVNGEPLTAGDEVHDVLVGSEVSVNAEVELPANGTFPAMMIGHSDINFKIFKDNVLQDERQDADFTVVSMFVGCTAQSELYAVPDDGYASYFEKSDKSPYTLHFTDKETGIEDVSVDENGVEEVYTLQGIRVTDTQNLRKGIYIVVRNGQATKKLVR